MGKKFLFWVLLIILLWTFVEGASLLSLKILKQVRHVTYLPTLSDSVSGQHKNILGRLLSGEESYLAFSHSLGWTIARNGRSELYQANANGIRADREYEPVPPENFLRICTFGDSFTHANSVRNPDAWQALMEKSVKNLEAINFGVPGYGLDQAYLRYLHEGTAYQPHIVFIGYMSDDLARHTSVYRPFVSPFTALPLAKPRFQIQDGHLVKIENPLKNLADYQRLLDQPEAVLPLLGKNDTYYQSVYRVEKGSFDFLPSVRLVKILTSTVKKRMDQSRAIIGGDYNPSSEEYNITVRLFDEFFQAAVQNGSLPVMVIFPQRLDVERYRRDGTKKYRILLEHFAQKGYPVIDIMDAFETYGKDYLASDFFDGHYSKLGYQLTARHVLKTLENNEWTSLEAVKREQTKWEKSFSSMQETGKVQLLR